MEPSRGPALAFERGTISVRCRTMSEDLWSTPLRDLMLNAAGRAAHYRLQAAALRDMAGRATTDEMASDLLELAVKYDTLAISVAN